MKSKRSASKKRRAPKKASTSGNDAALRKHLIELLGSRGAHADFDEAIEGLPEELRGRRAKDAPFTPWRLLEHLRMAQWDILEFSRNGAHVSPEFPEGYWPKTPAPANDDEWNDAISAFKRDLREMIRLVENPRTDLYAPIPHGQGQNILREALVLADHNSYHLGQLVDLRRALGSWPDA